MRISDIRLSVIPDSRGKDTLKVKFVSGKNQVVASVPSGKSKGKFEMVSLDPSRILKDFSKIKSEILQRDFSSLEEFDKFLISLDGTENKSKLGGNLILVLSIGFTKLLARSENLETYQLIAKILNKKPTKFPYLFINLIEGGMHAEDSLPFQEYFLVTKFGSPKKDMEYAHLVAEKIRDDVLKNFNEIRSTDEGALAIRSDNPRLGLEILARNVNDTNTSLALDAATSTFFEDGKYKIGERLLTQNEMMNLYQDYLREFKILSIEDPFSEEDIDGFIKIRQKFPDLWVVADDITVTNPKLIQNVANKKAANGVIIKPNQIGSVTETLQAINLAQNFGWKIIVSHRSGETMDDFVADLAFGAQADGFKSGGLSQNERLVKYGRLVQIEKKLN